MAWTPMHLFVDDEPARAEYFQGLWDNLDSLAFPIYVYNRSQTKPDTNFASTTSAAFVDVSASEMQVTIDLDGDAPGNTPTRDIIVMANIVCYISASDTAGNLDIAVDGVRVGDASVGTYTIHWADQPYGTPLFFLVTGLTAGEHIIKLQHRRNAGTGTVNTAIFAAHWFYAQEV